MANGVVVAEGENPNLPDRFRPGAVAFAEPESALKGGLDFTSLIRIIREWRWLILGAVALGLAAGIVISLLTKPLYRAAATLEVNPPSVEILDEKRRDAGSAPSNWDFVATQVGLLSSRSLAERVAQDLNLAANEAFVGTEGDAVTRLRTATDKVAAGLDVEPPEEGTLIRYTYVADSPVIAAQVANGVADSFISSSLQRRYEASAYAREFLQKQIAKTRGDLEKSERQLVAYAQSQGIINTSVGENGQPTGDTGSLQGESLVALNRALADATARRVQAEGAYRQARLEGGGSEVSEGTSAMRQTRATLEAEYQDKRTLLKPEHPEMLSLRSRIDELSRQINAERSQVASGRANSLLADFRAAASAESALRGRVAQLKGSVLDLRGRSIRYNILQRDVDTNRGLYDALLQRYKEVGVGGGVGTSPVSIVDRADVPIAPFKPNLPLNMMLGLLGGLLAGIGAAVALEFLNDTIKTREDVRTKLGLACLGVVPKSRQASLGQDLEDVTSPVSEAYSAVLATLRFSAKSGAPRALLVTSTQPAEGKSTSTLALARNYARRGETVLIIDADLRRPTFRGVEKTDGLVKLLTSDAPVREQVIETHYENLWLLPCGPISPNPADLLSSGRFAEIVEEAKLSFDRVIIDGPPVLGLADATLLSAVADGTMIVIEAGRTRTAAARQSIERINASGGHIVGVTLTKSKDEASHYGYRQYAYGSVSDKRKEMIMIGLQPPAETA